MKTDNPLILCIDDDREFLDSIRPIWEDGEYRMEAAYSAEGRRVRRYKAQRPDLILLDLMMEEVDAGTSFVKEVKALGNPPPILMLSSVGDNLNRLVGYTQLGVAGVLQKPLQPPRLLSTLRAKLAQVKKSPPRNEKGWRPPIQPEVHIANVVKHFFLGALKGHNWGAGTKPETRAKRKRSKHQMHDRGLSKLRSRYPRMGPPRPRSRGTQPFMQWQGVTTSTPFASWMLLRGGTSSLFHWRRLFFLP
ncbi:MAG: response regulator [Kiritimatiellia bacterium]